MNTAVLNSKNMREIVVKVSPRKYDFLMELLGNFDFVQVTEEANDGDSREEIIANLRQAGKDLQRLKAGKLDGRPLKEFLDEL